MTFQLFVEIFQFHFLRGKKLSHHKNFKGQAAAHLTDIIEGLIRHRHIARNKPGPAEQTESQWSENSAGVSFFYTDYLPVPYMSRVYR